MDFRDITAQYANTYANATNAALDALKSKVNSADYSSATDDELMEACKEFEAYFLEQIFKGMEKTIMYADEDSGSTNQLMDYYKDQSIQEIAKTATDTQGTGLAQILYEQMKRNYNL